MTSEPAAGLPPAFGAPTRAWFAGAFEHPTAAQLGAWAAIESDRHALVVAPTGSGKTLAAFLWSLDRLLSPGPGDRGDAAPGDPARRCRVLYISPLKALAADVERNLRSPLTGIRQAAARLGAPVRDVTVGMRTGDTPAAERRRFATHPQDILITTPESLFLILTSAARAGLAGVETVIVDEIHAVAGTKRGAHLAVSLERLDAFLTAGDRRPAQRVGLSATVRPVDAVATFLAGMRAPADGGRDVVVVQPPAAKQVEVSIVVPVPDLGDLGSAPTPGLGAGPAAPDPFGADGGALARRARASVWPHVEERVVDLVAAHRSTLVFTNSRRGAERLTARMNEVWSERTGGPEADPGVLVPSVISGQSGAAGGAAAAIARAHHGSMSRAERTRTEDELKEGRLPAVVATSSLELGIDMGAVDLVVQVGAPPSVASGLQRIGRAGHQVGAISRGVVFPMHRGDLVPAAVVAARMRTGEIEDLRVPANPLDVLAQQLVAMVAQEPWTVADLAATVRRSAPFAGLGDATFHAVLDMLAGRYPSEDFAELRARVVWDRPAGTVTGRPAARRLAVTSGGTIPDRGLFGVFLAADDGGARAARGGKRVGELDEEMVYESRVGDTFTLGSSTWRIEDITHDRVLVSPAPGVAGRLPFWKGDTPGRPAELGRAIGAWVREIDAGLVADPARAAGQLAAAGLDPWAADNLAGYLAEQRTATGRVPDDRTIVVERFRDELGDWRVVIHSPYGARVHAPWALVLGARLRERYGVDAATMHADDGIVVRLPDSEADWPAGSPDSDLGADGARPAGSARVTVQDLLIDPAEVLDEVRREVGGSVMFAARFREAAGRALLLPRRRPDRRQPLWQQRQRSAQLLSVAAQYPQFPIVLEAVRECLQDDFDVAALTTVMTDLAAGRIRLVEVTTTTPSPFASALLFGYTAQFLYDGDAPLAERRAAALSLDPALLTELLGGGGLSTELADLLDPDAIERTEAELGGFAPQRRARHAEDLADVLRRHGPLPPAELVRRTRPEVADAVPGWLGELEAARRAIRVRVAGVPPADADQWAAIEDAGRLRDALGVALGVGVPEVFTELVPDPLGDLVRRHARTHGPFTTAQVAARFGLGPAVVEQCLRRLERDRVLVSGRLRPEAIGGVGADWCDVTVLRILRGRSLAALRAEVEPVPAETLGVFLPRWHGVGSLRGADGVLRAVEQMAGAVLPASAIESLILPSRVTDYAPTMLDELTTSGEVLWRGHAPLPAGGDGLVSLHLADGAALTLPPPEPAAPSDPLQRAVLAALAGGGGHFLARIAAQVGAPSAEVLEALWELVWLGLVTNDGYGPMRARLAGAGAHRSAPPPGRARPMRRSRFATFAALPSAGRPPAGPPASGRPGAPLAQPPAGPPASGGPAAARALAPGVGAGRWSLLPPSEPDPTRRAAALARVLLDRHGVLTRAVAPAEGVASSFRAVYRVLTEMENAGAVRRGYFLEHLGGSQFALPGAVDELREDAREREQLTAALARAGNGGSTGRRRDPALLLAATDPANPYGAAVAWPPPTNGARSHRPGRKAGAVVVLVAGMPALYMERGGRTLLTFTTGEPLAAACRCLADAARAGRLGRIVIHQVDGAAVLARAGAEPVGVEPEAALRAAGFRLTPRGLRV